MDTVFARSTAPGMAGVAVVRISGPRAGEALRFLTRRDVPAARRAVLRDIFGSDDMLDRGLVLFFEAGRSFTGEQSAELHLHGSEAVVRSVLRELRALPGLRDAEPGEFTRRALENDRLDLAEVEGLGALLQAETEAQRRQAMRLVTGRMEAVAAQWRSGLLSALALLEASVDFADEDVPAEVARGVAARLHDIGGEMRREAAGVAAADQIARGFEVAIVGAPNAGKSTLLNRLAGREAALTSEIAGTTRDVLEVRMDISGQLVMLLDTAGIRDASDSVEALGVDRARRRADSADLRVFLDAVPEGIQFRANDLLVRGKVDLAGASASGLGVSGVTGEGVSSLLEAIGKTLAGRVSDAEIATTERQRVALSRAAEALAEAGSVLGTDSEATEVASALVRSALAALEELVGRVGVEDVLGEIFANFCIGK